MDTFTPSIDWSNEVAGSLWWLAEAWTISGAGLLAVGTLIARYTTWGRQFWEVTGGYFKGHDSIPVWGRLALLLMLVMVAVRINILLSYYSNDLYTALQVAFEGPPAATCGSAIPASTASGWPSRPLPSWRSSTPRARWSTSF
ncbi:ABC transporter transmembrane region 2 family protein [Mycobacterium kansasii 824]|uniref:ABC transporter transmembrane region 2 family protein n=1 Tax=Mycobacterium kansasii TaxID=1768 RepID=A0A1V3X8A2_MYCKA|nr:ABC transporter transmembrane region 2 family protein [Mycobacterium kansasii 824]OOK75382.1 ABC transporter transmembrane region 2 family protein [Mycobacterium kansasii]